MLSLAQRAAIADGEALAAEAERLYDDRGPSAAIPLMEQALARLESAFGAEDPGLAGTVSTLAALHHERGDHASAERLFQRALLLGESALGAVHPDIATAVERLASLYRVQRAWHRAEPLFARVLDIRERVFGDDAVEVEQTLNDLAEVYSARGAFGEAERLHKRVVRIRETIAGLDHPAVASALNNLAVNHLRQGRYAEAQTCSERGVRICQQAFGPEHPELAASLDTLAAIHHARGAHDEAERLHKRALHMRERLLGPDHPDVAVSLDNLAMLYQTIGAFARAEPLCARALDIRERKLGPEHPEIAVSLNNLATLYMAQCVYTEAESLLLRALEMFEHVLGLEHPEVATVLSSLGSLYRIQGAPMRAVPLFARALEICKQAFGLDHVSTATTLNNLAMAFYQGRRYAEAEALFERALVSCVRVFGPDHPKVITARGNLAFVYDARGAHDKAELIFQQVLSDCERTLGSDHPDVANALHNLAALYMDTGEDAKAAPLYRRAIGIYERRLGSEHRELVSSLDQLAIVTWRAGDIPRAIECFARSASVSNRNVGVALAVLPEARKRQFLEQQRGQSDTVAAFHAHAAPDDVHALALALGMTLQRKGRVLTDLAIANQALLSNPSPTTQHQLSLLRARREQLTAQRNARAMQATQAAAFETMVALERDVEQLERQLNQQVSALRVPDPAPTIEAVQAAVPANAVLVEFVRYRRFDHRDTREPWQEARYLAYLLSRDRPPAWVALGEEQAIDAAVTAALSALVEPQGDPRGPLRALDDLVFAPIRRCLGSIEHVLLSPDAALHLVPFAALVDEDGRYLAERMLISYVTSGRDLLRRTARGVTRSNPVVVAAPDYAGRHAPLRGAAAEAAAVRNHFANVEVYTGAAATKEQVASLHGPRFLHIASHGFFRGRQRGSSSRPRPSTWSGDRDVKGIPDLPTPSDDIRIDVEDALDDAGLILAGASDAEAVLTAREVAGLDLRGTQLVVLSACDTGVGEIERSEGVYGLRRALVIAGAETQVVSLWKVDDDATSRLMDRYYDELRGGRGRADGLRRTQLDMLRGERCAHPYYWAAFLPLGDIGPL